LPKDDREAARLFKLAADQGNASAQVHLGFFYSQGRGGLPKDDCEAARLYKQAADQGYDFGQFNLGVFHEHGRGGLPKDEREAARLYKLAADQGNARAQAALTKLDRQQQQQEEQQRQREAAARERQRRQEEQDRQKQEEQEAAARERRRRQGEQDPRRDAASGKMSSVQSLEILGLKAGATELEIRAAYSRLMKRVHPDVGGSDYFAKQVNDARGVLLGQRAR
jgi:TPR repeat protein